MWSGFIFTLQIVDITGDSIILDFLLDDLLTDTLISVIIIMSFSRSRR